MLATKILFARLGQGGAKLFFTVALGDESGFAITVRDCVLRDGAKGPFVAYPSKPRTRKATAAVDGVEQQVFVQAVGEDNKPVYDNIADLYFDKVEGQEERKATPQSWDLKKQITEQAQAMYEKLSGGNAGRGVAKAAGESAQYAKTTGAKTTAGVFDDDDSDDLPF